MNICLINPRGLSGPNVSLPHGLLSLCATLKQAGHDCRIIDACAPDSEAELSNLKQYDAAGISAMTTQLTHGADIARALPRGMPVIWGGVHALIDPQSLLNAFPDHFVVSGDGERPLLDVMSFLQGEKDREWLRTRPGISFHHDANHIAAPYFIRDINEYADIDYFDLPRLERNIDKYNYFFRGTFPTLRVITARGCAFNCSFCIHSIHKDYNALHRTKSMDKIRRETEPVIDAFKIKFVYPEDDNFFANTRLVHEWKKYAAEKRFLWGGNCRFDYIGPLWDGPALSGLAAHGMFLLTMSVEAGLESARNEILNKKLDDAAIERAAEILSALPHPRPVVHTNFLIGFPGDSNENKFKTIKWMDYLARRVNILFHGPSHYMNFPGTRLYDASPGRAYGDTAAHILNVAKELQRAGEPAVRYRDYFYTDFIRHRFNSPLRYYRLKPWDQGQPYDYAEDGPISAADRFKEKLKSMLFSTVRLRVRFNNRRMFFEPRLFALAKRAYDAVRGR